MDNLGPLLIPTTLLDFHHRDIRALVEERNWYALDAYERIGAAYDFVRDEIAFGYNAHDALPASRVLADGYGQCNTKGTLLMALLRRLEMPCRLHGFTIDKSLQRGAITGLYYRLAPQEILHSWVEVWFRGRWLNLEGFILDRPYLAAIQRRFPECSDFCGYAVATEDLQQPRIDWAGDDTYIQRTGIVRDLGVFDDPDFFYLAHRGNLGGLRGWLFAHIIRHRINRHVQRLRRS